MNKVKREKHKSVTTELLLALVPYTRQNLMLTYSPNRFFNELDRIGMYSGDSYKQAYYRAKKNKLITVDEGRVSLSNRAKRTILPYTASKLLGNVRLMVIFDIPEEHSHIRRQFRSVLRDLQFDQIQQSVWMTDKDYTKELQEIISDLGARDWIKMFESAPIE